MLTTRPPRPHSRTYNDTSSKYVAQSRLHVRGNLRRYKYVIISERVKVSVWGQLPCAAGLYRGLRYANCVLRHSLPCSELLNSKQPRILGAVATWPVSSSTPKCNLKFPKIDIRCTTESTAQHRIPRDPIAQNYAP
jgi:hypothetical protein